ncbi:MAG TPA: BMP family ABC transporter substrate-binding protein, partial [Thermomicrobiales bacterium]|nr:BMP family ABC transporter substrate-binding protein [Thermomicrobiales bacterium]
MQLWRWILMTVVGVSASILPGSLALPAVAQGVEVDRVAIVTPASRTNQGWDQQGVNNLESVGAELGITVDVVENAGYDDITPILNDLVDDGADLIVCHASGYQTVCPEFAQSTGVPVVVIENPGAVMPGLIADIETQGQEAAFLAGVVAGLETTTGTVAVVVSGEPPSWNYMTVGFAEGLHSVNPDATLIYQVIGDAAYDDAPNAKRVTESVIAAGADIVFGMGDGASFGMIQAINEANADRELEDAVQFIDVIGDKSGTDAGTYLLTSVLFDYTHAYTS